MKKKNYDSLMELSEPFFKLKHGKLYECKVCHDKREEDMTIIPLAFKPSKNCLFVMIDARKLFAENPMIVRDIIEMDFAEIMNDGIRSFYPFDYSACTILCATQSNGVLVDYSDEEYYDFQETNVI